MFVPQDGGGGGPLWADSLGHLLLQNGADISGRPRKDFFCYTNLHAGEIANLGRRLRAPLLVSQDRPRFPPW